MFDPKKLIEAREKKKLSPDEVFAALIHMRIKMSCTTYRNWENNKQIPNANELKKLSAFFKKPMNYFFKEDAK